MQRKSTPSILLLAFIFFTVSSARSQVTTDSLQARQPAPAVHADSLRSRAVSDTSAPNSIDPQLLELSSSKVPKEFIIGAIKITGTKYLDEQLLVSIAGISVGDKVTVPGGDNFSKAINNLWKQNLFANIQIYFTKLYDGHLDIEINVTERPRLATFTFKGIKKADSDELNKKTGLVKGRVVTENTKRSAVDAIKKYFIEKGFQGAEVKVNEINDASKTNSVNIVFDINRGPKVRINEVNFFGNDYVNGLMLKKKLKGTKEMTRISLYPSIPRPTYGPIKQASFRDYLGDLGFLSFSKTKEYLDPYFRLKLFSSAKFSQKKYDEDKEKIVQYYNSLGFRDANIGADTQYVNEKGNLNIDLKINEGRRYYFGNIGWKGNTKYSDSILSLILGIKKGDIYNAQTLNRKLGKELTQEGGDISGLYQDDGYLFFRIDPVETAVYNDTIDFEIRIVEGPQATIKNITISGNEKTKEHVIRREIRTLPGEKFSRTDLIRSQREISQLGYFNQEKIGINPVPNPDDGTVDIQYTVEEKSSDQLELSAGWGGGIGLTGTLGVSFNNFSINNIFNRKAWDPLPTGDGQKFSVRVQSNGRAYQSYNASFTEPWLGGKKRNSLTFSLYKSVFRTGGIGRNGQYFFSDTNRLKNFGASVSLGKQLKWPDDFFTLVYSLNYTQYKLINYPLFTQAFRSGTSNNVNFKVALSRNSSGPNPVFPTTGSNFLLSAQFTPPYSLFNKSITNETTYKLPEFTKWRLNSQWFIPLGKAMGADKSKQFVLMAAAKYGFMGRYNRTLGFSPFERFQLGDAGLANGNYILGYDIIAQRGYPVYQSSDPKVNPDQQSATQFFTMFNKYQVELRFPFATNPSSTIYGLAWFEAANGWYDYKTYNPFRLRRSAGLGMRFFLPMFGLLGFDYGIGFDRITPGGGIKNASRFTFMLGYEPE